MSAYQNYNLIFIFLRGMWNLRNSSWTCQITWTHSYNWSLKIVILHFHFKNWGKLQHNSYAVVFPNFWNESAKWRFWASNMSAFRWFEKSKKSWARFTCLPGIWISNYNFDMRTFGTRSIFSPGVKMWRAVRVKGSGVAKISLNGLRNCPCCISNLHSS